MDLAAYLTAEWSELLAETGIDPAYIVGQVEAVYVEQPDLDLRWAEALADYYLLRRAVRAFAVDFDVTIDGDSYRLSQRKQVESLLAQRSAEVGWIVNPSGDGAETIGKVVTISARYLTGGEYERGDGW